MIEEILFGDINRELLTSLVPLGYLIFILYFYGSEKWNEFSDFDKISFSTVMSFIVLYFLVMPFSWTYIHIYNFFIFNGESNIISPPQAQFIDTYIAYLSAIVSILFIVRMISNGSLYENKKVYTGIYLTVLFFLLFFATLLCFFIMSFYMGGYPEYFIHIRPTSIILSCIFLALFLIVFETTHKNHDKPLSFIDSHLSRSYTKRYAIMAVMIFLIFSVATGMFLFKPSIVENGEQVTEMYVELLSVSDMPKHKYINAQKTVEKYYVVKTPILIPWVKIETNLTLKSATGEIEGNYNQYYINDNYFIVNDSSKQVNVTAIGTTEDFYLTDELIYSPPDHTFQNETEMVNLTLTNNIPTTINIKEIEIRIDGNYVLTEDNFVKTQHFANGNGGIGGYEQGESTLHLQNIHLLENASGTISLILIKQ